jgi:hypothetical protein
MEDVRVILRLLGRELQRTERWSVMRCRDSKWSRRGKLGLAKVSGGEELHNQLWVQVSGKD